MGASDGSRLVGESVGRSVGLGEGDVVGRELGDVVGRTVGICRHDLTVPQGEIPFHCIVTDPVASR